MPPSRVTTSPRPSSRRSERFCLDLPRASSGAASLVESTQVAKFVMSRATDEVSTPYSATIFAATLLLISVRCSAEIWFIASQKRRWSSFAALILVNRGPAVLTHQLEICAFEHGATTRFSAAMTRNLPTDTPLTGAAPATTSSMICVAQIIDDVVAGAAPVKGVSVGRFLVIAALNRVVAPCSKAQISNWWVRTAGPRFTRISAAKLDHRRFWDAMNQISAEHLTEISSRVAAKIVAEYGVDTSSVALDMTNFATWVDSTNDAAPLLARGRSKQKRSDLRLLGLGLVVTRDGGIPLAWHAYRGNRPDVSVFTQTLDALTASYRLIAGAAEPPDSKGTDSPARNTKSNDGLTVVFDAGQNSAANFTYLTGTGAKYVGSTPPSDHQDLLKVPASSYQLVTGFDGLTAYESAKTIYGQPQRVVMTHSPTLHAAQSRGFDQTLTKAADQLDELAATLARGRTRSTREQLTARIDRITHNTWVTEVLAVTLTGNSPKAVSYTHLTL